MAKKKDNASSCRLEDVIKWSRLPIGLFKNFVNTEEEELCRILRQREGISPQMAEDILDAFPTINPDWLKEGIGYMLKNNKEL